VSNAEITLRREGFIHPYFTVTRAQQVGLALAAAMAMLTLESSKGHNEFGHDWDFQYAGMDVTEERYRALRAAIEAGHPSNGVGPCQLTSVSLLDAADNLGGAWKVEHNMRVGFNFLKDLINEYGLQGGFSHYNGTGPAAEEYGQRAIVLYEQYDKVL
jgi:hypothetical protein